jgi:hypothetical protein
VIARLTLAGRAFVFLPISPKRRDRRHGERSFIHIPVPHLPVELLRATLLDFIADFEQEAENELAVRVTFFPDSRLPCINDY